MTDLSPVTTTVHLVRHGEVYNPDRIMYGRLPGFVLSDNGSRQAELVAEYLTGRDVAFVVASPLDRAQQTAKPIAEPHGLPIDTDDGLIEAGNAFEGFRFGVGDGALRRPRHWAKLRNPFLPSWGEPYLQIAQRMAAALERARAAAAGHEAVCVSHQLPIWTLRRYVTGGRLWHDPRRRECSLASVTSVVFRGDQMIQLRYAEPAGVGRDGESGA